MCCAGWNQRWKELEVEEMTMNGVYYAVLIENVIIMICWTILAINFGKWWIALFSVCCFSSLKHRTDEKGDGKDEK